MTDIRDNAVVQGATCPIPISQYPNILLAHGGGGTLTHQLIEKMLLPEFRNQLLEPLHDGAILSVNGMKLAFSTDSYVVNPIFFPGGNIGELAINGTVNDLAMCGATPLFLSAAFIIEEGFSMEELWKVVRAMHTASLHAGVQLVTGDTKVVERGKGDHIFITTSGIGVIQSEVNINPRRASVGDNIIINGPIGSHGIAIMSVREGLEFTSPVISDTAPLNGLVTSMLTVCRDIHVMRDPTRGGVASALNEIAASANVGIMIDENSIPVPPEVRGACEILGLDPLYIANEGKLLAFIPPEHAENVLKAMRQHPLGKESVIIGEVVSTHPGLVVMKSRIGGTRIVDMISGEQLPRIC
ncbi:MAG: hydrogenase expression/formation protein HypE [Bacteroidetes bacterium]|nr:MAG: hydrogenase expression/formation protein HypE [Bacteroidota bacterium]